MTNVPGIVDSDGVAIDATTERTDEEDTGAGQHRRRLTTDTTKVLPPPPKHLRLLNTSEINVLLLENVSQTAVNLFRRAGFQVETHAKALPEDVLIEKLRSVHVVGIRSKTQLTQAVLANARSLLAIGCFCIGTNQVDLDYAATRGISVFNSPFSNSRSVAEITLANIINLARQLGDRNSEMHAGSWNKVSARCYEIRGKTLGIVGYGHIGSQLSVMAEAMGMNVIFYDILQIMPLGRARPVDSLADLLKDADFVTLHVPATPDTKNMIGAEELAMMKNGSYLLNASRGNVVVIPALAEALKSGHLAGCAVDVYPKEPHSNGGGFETELIGCPNTILTPHIGGSTEEAQSSIGVEVATNLIKYINLGCTLGSVNLPEADLRAMPAESKYVRVVNVHQNVRGVLKQINRILSEYNIEKQVCESKGPVAYFMADVAFVKDENLNIIYNSISSIPENIVTRVLY